MIEAFSAESIDTGVTTIFTRRQGAGPAVLLLHGFPETHLMWRAVAPILARDFTVVCADLRGYGRSGCPPSAPDHVPYSKRAMAADMVAVMEDLGFPRFSVVGHDRGGRVSYRMALDQPDRVDRLAVLDIVPTADAWDRADADLALGYWPWSLLAQPEPLPERILTAAADQIVENALTTWGGSPVPIEPQDKRAYVEALQDPEHAHAICEEYRAAAGIDREHDEQDRAAGRRIRCPVLVLWSESGPLGSWYAGDGGPLGVWHTWADHVSGHAMSAGHFFPEELPVATADALRQFLQRP